MDNQPNQPAQGGSKAGMLVIIVVAVIIIAEGAYYFLANEGNTNNANVVANSSANTNTDVGGNNNTANTNTATNTSEAMNTNEIFTTHEAVNTNTAVDTSAWETYENTPYRFSISFPQGIERWESILNPAVVSQRTDGLIFETGFRPAGFQGSLFLIRVSTQSLNDLTRNNPQEFGQLSDSTFNSGLNTWTELTGADERYGIERNGYSFIVEIQDESSDYNLALLHEMLSMLRFTQ